MDPRFRGDDERRGKEEFVAEEGTWVTVTSASRLAHGEIAGAKVGEAEIAVYNVDGAFYATSNICTHAHAFLSEGWLDGDEVECPLHAGRFDVKTGKALCPPVEVDIKTYPVRVVGDEIQIRLD
jgi:nitrite reductase/ring-hydroxylating ferredoxin subunit